MGIFAFSARNHFSLFFFRQVFLKWMIVLEYLWLVLRCYRMRRQSQNGKVLLRKSHRLRSQRVIDCPDLSFGYKTKTARRQRQEFEDVEGFPHLERKSRNVAIQGSVCVGHLPTTCTWNNAINTVTHNNKTSKLSVADAVYVEALSEERNLRH